MNSEHIGDEAGRADIVAAPLPRPWRAVYAEVMSDAEAFDLRAFGTITEDTLEALEGFIERQRRRIAKDEPSPTPLRESL